MHVLVWSLAMYGAAALALWRGGREERATALVLVLGYWTNRLRNHSNWLGLDPMVTMVDIIVLGFLLHQAFRSDRFWPMWAAAGQLGNVLGAIPYILSEKIWSRTYNIISVSWSYVIVIALIAGLLLESRSDRQPLDP